MVKAWTALGRDVNVLRAFKLFIVKTWVKLEMFIGKSPIVMRCVAHTELAVFRMVLYLVFFLIIYLLVGRTEIPEGLWFFLKLSFLIDILKTLLKYF